MRLALILVFCSLSIGGFECCTWTLGNSCYTFVSSTLPFWSAETECSVAYGGHLVAVTTQEEDDFLRMRLIEKFINDETCDGYIALLTGGFFKEGAWAWTSGESFVYSNWSPGEPNEEQYGDVTIEYLWSISADLAGQFDWFDRLNIYPDSTGFICESMMN